MGNVLKLSALTRRTGFTLSELMIAAAILLVAILGLFTTVISCIWLNESNNNLVVAANGAQYVLERIKGLPYANITSSYSPPTFSIDNQVITPEINVSDITSNLKEVLVNVNWTERQRNRNFSVSTRIAR